METITVTLMYSVLLCLLYWKKKETLQNKIFHLRHVWTNQGVNLPGKMGFKCLENKISLLHLIFEIMLNWDVSELTAPSEFAFSSCHRTGEQRPQALLPFYCLIALLSQFSCKNLCCMYWVATASLIVFDIIIDFQPKS